MILPSVKKEKIPPTDDAHFLPLPLSYFFPARSGPPDTLRPFCPLPPPHHNPQNTYSATRACPPPPTIHSTPIFPEKGAMKERRGKKFFHPSIHTCKKGGGWGANLDHIPPPSNTHPEEKPKKSSLVIPPPPYFQGHYRAKLVQKLILELGKKRTIPVSVCWKAKPAFRSLDVQGGVWSGGGVWRGGGAKGEIVRFLSIISRNCAIFPSVSSANRNFPLFLVATSEKCLKSYSYSISGILRGM